MIERLRNFYNIGITKEGKTNKLSVVLRTMATAVILYAIVGAVTFGILDERELCTYFVVVACIYLSLIHICVNFDADIKVAVVSSIEIIISIVGFFLVGPRGLFQLFVFVLIILSYFSTNGHYVRKAIYSIILCAVYLILSVAFGNIRTVSVLNVVEMTILQMLNTFGNFVCTAIMCTVFSMDSQKLESKLYEYNKILMKQASTDVLTGLNNRRVAIDYIEELIQKKDDSIFCVCMCDIDFFKKVNDSYGHDIGDNVLRGVAQTMQENLPRNCMISRWGGEEFLVIFPRMNGDYAKEILDILRSKVKKLEFSAGEKKFSITVTYGLAEYGYRGDGDELVKEADKKLYMGKENGRDQVVY